MKQIRLLFIPLIALALILVIGQWIHQTFIYPSILKEDGWLIGLVNRKIQQKPKVLYFSASPNAAFAPDDTTRKSICEFANDLLPYKINPIDTGAIHAGIFLKILNKIPSKDYPEAIVIDLNSRSFGVNWLHSSLENALQRNFVYWNNRPSVWNHFLAATKWYDYKSPAEHLRAIEFAEKFSRLPLKKEHSTIKKWIDELEKSNHYTEEGSRFIRHFGFHITKDNQQVSNYDQIAIWAKKCNIPLIFVILPENIQGMNDYAGKDLCSLVARNAFYLKKRYEQANVTVLNLYNQLPNDQFFEEFPTEHYRWQGRQFVGNAIAKELLKIKQL